MNFTIYVVPKKTLNYTNKSGKKVRVKPKSQHFKVINHFNPASYWAGKASLEEAKKLDEKICFDSFLENCPKVISKEAIPGGKVFQAFDYLFSEDFRTIDDGMIEVFDKIRIDLNKSESEDFSQIRDFLVKYKDHKIFSTLECKYLL